MDWRSAALTTEVKERKAGEVLIQDVGIVGFVTFHRERALFHLLVWALRSPKNCGKLVSKEEVQDPRQNQDKQCSPLVRTLDTRR